MNKNGTTMGQGQGVLADDRVDTLKQKARDLVERGEHKVDAIRSRVVEVKDQAVTRGNDVLARTNDLIKANPMKAIGIAFALGYFGMRLFRR